jgi:O-antigen ligase
VIALAEHRVNLSAAPSFLNTSANAVAMYFEPPFAFALAFVVFASRPRERWLAAGVLALVTVALIVSFSRASYLAVAVLASVLVLSTQNPRRRLRALAGLAVLGLIVIEIPFVSARFLTLANSVANRESLYTQALQMLSHMPITGAGIDGFATRVAPYRPRGEIIHIYPHDMWLTTWSELGLLGVIAFGVIFFGLLWTGARALSLTRDVYRPLLWGAVGALVLHLVHGFFDSPYWKNDLSVEFWFVAALLVVGVRSTRVAATDSERGGGPQPSQVLLEEDPRLRGGGDQREREVQRS